MIEKRRRQVKNRPRSKGFLSGLISNLQVTILKKNNEQPTFGAKLRCSTGKEHCKVGNSPAFGTPTRPGAFGPERIYWAHAPLPFRPAPAFCTWFVPSTFQAPFSRSWLSHCSFFACEYSQRFPPCGSRNWFLPPQILKIPNLR